MKRRPMMIVTVATLSMMLLAGEVLAANGRGAGMRNGSHAQAQSTTAGTTTAVRPAGSQRRDGTFLTTGTTANGGTTRPTNGRGLQDGTGK